MFERTKDLRLSVIKQVEIESSKYDNIISLAQGIPSFDTPECIKDRVKKAMDKGQVARYSLSPGLPELRKKISAQLKDEGMDYDWEREVIVTVGTIEAITATILAITESGDEIIIPKPTYTSYREVIKLAGCKPVYVPLSEEDDWAFQLEEFEKAITPKTKAIFYCNPNNPTGTVYSKEQLMGLAKLAEKHDLFLISDEVYKDLIYTEEELFSLAELPELKKRVIRLFGFSKSYAMTGWRVGYLHSDESVVAEILKVHDAMVTCAPVISQYAAIAALDEGNESVEYFRSEYKKRRDLVCERLDNLKHVFSYVVPNGAYYIFLKFDEEFLLSKLDLDKDNLSLSFVYKMIEDIQVSLVPGFAFGDNGEGHVRLSFGKCESEISEAFDRIDKYLQK